MERFFKKNGFTIKLVKDENEPMEHFIERGEFVVSQKPLNDDDYEYAIKLSRIYRNNKYNKAVYSKKLMKDIDDMVKKMFEE